MNIILMMEPEVRSQFLQLLNADRRVRGHNVVVVKYSNARLVYDEYRDQQHVLVVESEPMRGVFARLNHERGRLQVSHGNIWLCALMAVNIAEAGTSRGIVPVFGEFRPAGTHRATAH